MKSIAQFFRVEWGEYRGTLFGLWAGLVLLILVAFFSSARPYVMDQTSPILFAGFGYLGFALAVLPRVFRPEFKDPQRGFLRRTPGGLNHSFLGKSLFVYTGMLLSALVPMATTFALLYILDPAGMEWLAFVQEDFAEVGMFVVAINALPLLLFAWGLSFRWMLLAVPVAVAMVYGACKLVMVTSYYSLAGSGVGPYMAIYMGLFTGPWLVAWYSYRAPKGRTQLKRWLYTTAVLGGGLGSAWGLGAVGTYKQIKQIHSFDPEDQELLFEDSYLSSNGRFVYSSVRTAKRHLPHSNWLPHTIRIDLEDGSIVNFGMGNILQITPEGMRRDSGTKMPRTDDLLRLDCTPQLPWMLKQSPAAFSIQADTGRETQVDYEAVISDTWPNPEADVRLDPWQVMPYEVGLGSYMMAKDTKRPQEVAIYDSSRDRVFAEDELPFAIDCDLILRQFRVLPRAWLVPPMEQAWPIRLYNPESKRLEDSEALDGGDILGPALADGTVLVRKGTNFAIFDTGHDSLTHLKETGSVPPAPFFDIPKGGPPQEYFAIHLPGNAEGLSPRIVLYDIRLRGPSISGRMDRFLGWVDSDRNTIHWYPWTFRNRIFGIIDEKSIIFTQDQKRIVRMDLETGEQMRLYPFPR